MSAMASHVTGVSIVCLTVCSGSDQGKHQAQRHWPLWGESTGDRWIPSQRAKKGKCFHLLTSSCTYDSLQYIPWNIHMALFCFVLLWLCFHILMYPNDLFIHIAQGLFHWRIFISVLTHLWESADYCTRQDKICVKLIGTHARTVCVVLLWSIFDAFSFCAHVPPHV